MNNPQMNVRMNPTETVLIHKINYLYSHKENIGLRIIIIACVNTSVSILCGGTTFGGVDDGINIPDPVPVFWVCMCVCVWGGGAIFTF